MDFTELTIVDLRRLVATIRASGGDELLQKLIDHTPIETADPHGRVTIGTLLRLLAQTDGCTVLPDEAVLLLRALANPDRHDASAVAEIFRLIDRPIDESIGYEDNMQRLYFDELPVDQPAHEPIEDDEEFIRSVLDTSPEHNKEDDPFDLDFVGHMPELPEPDVPEDWPDDLFDDDDAWLGDQCVILPPNDLAPEELDPPAPTLVDTSILTEIATAYITVDMRQSLAKRIHQANLLVVDRHIMEYAKRTPIVIAALYRYLRYWGKPKRKKVGIFSLRPAATWAEVDAAVTQLGYTHATIDDLVAFGDQRLVCLNTVACGTNLVMTENSAGLSFLPHLKTNGWPAGNGGWLGSTIATPEAQISEGTNILLVTEEL